MKDTSQYQIVRLAGRSELKERTAQWYSEKWCIPKESRQVVCLGREIGGDKPVRVMRLDYSI